MTIQYASDLHIEFPENRHFLKNNPIQPVGDILVLAGDIVTFTSLNQHSAFFDYLSDNFRNTYWVPGNHEYYRFDLASKCGTFHDKIRKNVHLLNNTIVQEGDVHLFFSTLWGKISPAYSWQIERGMNDFHLIKYKGNRFSTDRFNEQHEENRNFLKNALKSTTEGKTIVATHHVPTFMNYPEQYKGDLLNEAFAVELSGLIEEYQPDCWIYGHTHKNNGGFHIGKTQLLCNQLGYVGYGEHHAFFGSKVVEV